jgi:hypothetical protein
MPTRTFNSGRIRKAQYDPDSRQLDLYWDSGTVRVYKHVPAEVFRRLCSAPNPTTYWEDRIAEEYPSGTVVVAREQAKPNLDDLFGGAD